MTFEDKDRAAEEYANAQPNYCDVHSFFLIAKRAFLAGDTHGRESLRAELLAPRNGKHAPRVKDLHENENGEMCGRWMGTLPQAPGVDYVPLTELEEARAQLEQAKVDANPFSSKPTTLHIELHETKAKLAEKEKELERLKDAVELMRQGMESAREKIEILNVTCESHIFVIKENEAKLASQEESLGRMKSAGKAEAFQEAFDFLTKEKVMPAKSPLADWFRGMWKIYKDEALAAQPEQEKKDA